MKRKQQELILPNYPIRQGDRGLDVARLQAILDVIYKRKGKKKLQSLEPSYFGYETRDLILHFQAEHDIKLTGVYDHLTRQKIRETLCR